MTPYYADDLVTIYHGDCREWMPEANAIVTDPPYEGYDGVYDWPVPDLEGLLPAVHSLVFWKGPSFPLDYTARHIWSKANRNLGSRGEQYEDIYELNGGFTGLVMRHAVIDSEMNATLNGDVFLDHPTQKPIRLLTRLVLMTSGTVLDPFMGSGTTLRAAKSLGRASIGIDISERYCEMAALRSSQEVLGLSA